MVCYENGNKFILGAAMKTETSYFCFHLASKDQFPAADISEVTGQDQMEAQPVQKGRGRKQ